MYTLAILPGGIDPAIIHQLIGAAGLDCLGCAVLSDGAAERVGDVIVAEGGPVPDRLPRTRTTAKSPARVKAEARRPGRPRSKSRP